MMTREEFLHAAYLAAHASFPQNPDFRREIHFDPNDYQRIRPEAVWEWCDRHAEDAGKWFDEQLIARAKALSPIEESKS